MRQINTHQLFPFTHTDNLNDSIRIEPADDPDETKASSKYQIFTHQGGEWQKASRVEFHKGPSRNENEMAPQPLVNGVSDEVLMAVLIDRIENFQKGKLACEEYKHALTHLEESLHWLHARTKQRIQRGVEGLLIP